MRRRGVDRPKRVDLEQANYQTLIAQASQTIREKADKLLAAILLQTPCFGQEITVNIDWDYPLAYAENDIEFAAPLRHLEELEFVKLKDAGREYIATLKAKGIEAVESRKLLPPLTVFLSSTCLDLADLRAERAAFLDGQECTVRISEDPDRFNVDPTGDAMKTCLRNVETSDVVICILDRRYGGVTNAGPYPELSATHAEFRHAKGRDPQIPTCVFFREKAMADYYLLANDPATETLWVEPQNAEGRKQ